MDKKALLVIFFVITLKLLEEIEANQTHFPQCKLDIFILETSGQFWRLTSAHKIRNHHKQCWNTRDYLEKNTLSQSLGGENERTIQRRKKFSEDNKIREKTS